MFGFFRLGLALLVLIYHLSQHHFAGWYSVYAFYALSGFLITLVVTKKYAPTLAGTANFAINRALRIYPPYLAVCLMSLVILKLPAFADTAKALVREPDMGLPQGAVSWFENLFILGWRMGDPKLVPQMWTVFRELFYCALIFVLFARYRWAALAWFAGSLVYAVTTIVRGLHFIDIYTSFQAASIAYSAGCCIYHFQPNLRRLTEPLVPLICVVALLPFVLEMVRPHFFAHGSVVPFYWNIALSAYLVLLLARLKGSPRLRAIDHYLGNLSYPIYLCHFNVAVVVTTLLGWPAETSHRLLFVSLLPILICAWAINRYVEQTIGYGYDQRRQPWFTSRQTPVEPAAAIQPAEATR